MGLHPHKQTNRPGSCLDQRLRLLFGSRVANVQLKALQNLSYNYYSLLFFLVFFHSPFQPERRRTHFAGVSCFGAIQNQSLQTTVEPGWGFLVWTIFIQTRDLMVTSMLGGLGGLILPDGGSPLFQRSSTDGLGLWACPLEPSLGRCW